MRKRVKVCVVCSAGGHLTEALLAVHSLTEEYYLITFRQKHVGTRLSGKKVYFVIDPHTSMLKFMVNCVQSLWLFLWKRPKVIITTGAGIALSTCLIAKLFRAKLLVIETGARVTTPSRTGRLLYKYADVFIVQWEPLLLVYPKAIYGEVLL